MMPDNAEKMLVFWSDGRCNRVAILTFGVGGSYLQQVKRTVVA